MWLINFLASQKGRGLRVIVGVLLIVVAMVAWHGLAEGLGVLLGVILISVGVFDVCLFAPLFGKPFSGKKLRG